MNRNSFRKPAKVDAGLRARTARTGLLQRFARNDKGAVAVIAAILFPVVVGAMGLGAETGYWYLKQRKLQHAADVAAHAAALRHRAGDEQAALEAAALVVADKSGFSAEIGALTVGAEAASGGARVAVQLVETHPRLFSSVFSSEPVELGARAVAQVTGGSQACVLALSPTASGAITVDGSTSVTLANCSVASNSNASNAFLMDSSNAKITTDCVYTVGEAVTTTGLVLNVCSGVTEQAPRTVDPYAGLAEPDRTQARQVFAGGLKVLSNLHLEPGIYIVEGDLTVAAGATLTGEGVTFLFTGSGCSKLTGNGNINLSAPTTGPYAGLLFFGSRTSTCVEHEVLGNSASTLQGTLYMPVSPIKFSGNSTVGGGCTQIIADQVTFTGNSSIETCTTGTKEILVGQTIALVE